jgi:hypothetical protein
VVELVGSTEWRGGRTEVVAETITTSGSPSVQAGLPEVPPVRERRSWPLPMVAPDLAAVVILVFAGRRLEGPELVKAILLAGVVLLVRRGTAGAWLGRDPAGPDLATSRRKTRRGALRMLVLMALGGSLIAVLSGHSPAVGPVIALCALPASLLTLEHQALRSCARRRQLLASAAAGSLASMAAGAVLLLEAPSVLGALLALAVGDLVSLAVAWHRPHGGTCHERSRASSTPLETHRRPLSSAATASVLVGAMHLLPLGLVFRSGADDTLNAALVVLGLLPLVAAGSVPVLVVPGLTAGRRETIVPALITGAILGTLATLLVMAAPGRVLALPDHRLEVHAAYFCVAMATLGLAQVLLHYRVGTGNDRTGVILVVLAGGVELALMMVGTGPPAEVAVNAALGAAAVLVASLAVATVVAFPFPFVFAPEEVSGGPRLVGPALLGLVVVGAVARLVSLRPMWLDEAAAAQLARGPFSSMLESAPTTDAHPPLEAALTWAAKQAFGDGPLALRVPSLLAGTLLIPLLYVAGRELYSRRTGLVAAALGAVAPALMWFSAEARPPAVTALLAVASLVTMVRALRWERGTDWVLFGLCGAALMWSHQLAFVHLLVLNAAVAAVLWRRRRESRPVASSVAGWAVAGGVVLVATIPLLIARSGLGPPRTLPPFEFATAAAPAGGVSVFATLGTVLQGLLGFHPADVTSRLLALWPLGILAALLAFGRARSARGVLLVALCVAPFLAVLAAQLLDAPRSPPLALSWAATAVPILCLVAARAISLFGGSWRKTRLLTVGAGLVLVMAAVDQVTRVEPLERFDVNPAVRSVGEQAGPNDLIVYEPGALRHLVAYEAEGTEARPLERASSATLPPHDRLYIIGAFALTAGDESVDRAVGLVKEVSATRPLLEERRGQDITVWVFGP